MNFKLIASWKETVNTIYCLVKWSYLGVILKKTS